MDVIDYKYGQGVPVSAENNPQMQLYGLGAYSEYGYIYDVKKLRLHIFQPRIDNVSTWELNLDSLLNFAKHIADRAELALGDLPELVAGAHCKFCPHAGHCPELAAACIDKATVGDTLAPDPSTMTPAALSFVLGVEPMLKSWLESVKAAALSELKNGADVPGFKLVAGRQGNREWVDEFKVAEALEAAGLTRDEYTTVKLKSPADVDTLLGKTRANKLLKDLIKRAPGSPTIAPASDKRPKLDAVKQANDDFNKE